MSESDASKSATVSLGDVVAAFRLVRSADAALRLHGLSVALLSVLAALAAHLGEPIGATMNTLDIVPSAATSYIDRLEKDGFVTRSSIRTTNRAHVGDRRAVMVDLTDLGRELLAAFAAIEVAQ